MCLYDNKDCVQTSTCVQKPQLDFLFPVDPSEK